MKKKSTGKKKPKTKTPTQKKSLKIEATKQSYWNDKYIKKYS